MICHNGYNGYESRDNILNDLRFETGSTTTMAGLVNMDEYRDLSKNKAKGKESKENIVIQKQMITIAECILFIKYFFKTFSYLIRINCINIKS